MIRSSTSPHESTPADAAPLRAKRMGILTLDEPIVFMRTDCHACRSEGLSSRSRVLLQSGGKSVVATLYQVTSELLDAGEAGLSEAAWEQLDLTEGDLIVARHPDPLVSFAHVRSRIFGNRLSEGQFHEIINDIAQHRYSAIETTAYLVSGSSFSMDDQEMHALTKVMVDLGDTLTWPGAPIMDKHCVGGLPGNRTTPIVVAILAALGLTIPKTSSRAITSPAGTADAMETLAPVDLDLVAIRRVVEQEGGCVAWGGAVRLSPADDLLIRVERVLDLDSEGQLVASVLSKKVAAGATHLVLDIPVGPTAKIRTPAAAAALAGRLRGVAAQFGITTSVVISDGSAPVGFGIGPALEAHDVLAVLQLTPGYPTDLHARACVLAGAALEMVGRAAPGMGIATAVQAISDGSAWSKFQRICEAQGGMRVPLVAALAHPQLAALDGYVTAIDNRKIARVAKLAGAPGVKVAGVKMFVRVGDKVSTGQPLYAVHADTDGELRYALDYVLANPDIIRVSEQPESIHLTTGRSND